MITVINPVMAIMNALLGQLKEMLHIDTIIPNFCSDDTIIPSFNMPLSKVCDILPSRVYGHTEDGQFDLTLIGCDFSLNCADTLDPLPLSIEYQDGYFNLIYDTTVLFYISYSDLMNLLLNCED